MASNYKNYLDYAGLQKFWEEAKKYFNNLIAESTGSIEALKDRVQTIQVTYDNNVENIVTITQGTGQLGSSASINMSAYAKKADIAAALNFRGGKTVEQMEALSGMSRGDVYTVIAGGQDVPGSQFAVGCEYAWDGSNWIELGGAIDLSGYVTTSDLAAALADYVQTSDLDDYVTLTALQTALADYVDQNTFDALASRVAAVEDGLDNIQEVEDSEIEALFA